MTSRPPAGGRSRAGKSFGAVADPARRAAYDVLHEVGSQGSYANLVLRQVLADRRLDTRDAAFATELVMGVLRHRGTLDVVLAKCVDRTLDRLDPRVLDVLRLGSYQLLYLATAVHAAVSATVDLARSVAGEGPSKLVNAVLRKVSRSDLDSWLGDITSGIDDPVEKLAVRYSHPRWIVAALRDALPAGSGEADLIQLLATNNEPPTVTLVARPGVCEPSELLASDGGEMGRYSPYAVRLGGGGNPGAIPAVRQQRAGVQDEGSQLVALAFAGARLTGPDQRWLDMCAGPGGKAALLGALGAQRGAELLAVEPRQVRARLVVRALSRIPTSHTVVADSREGPWQAGYFDRVLVDAPCTGLGVLRRRPESRWRRGPADVAALARLQRELLMSALDAVRVGGIVGYATCSPHIAETDLLVDEVLAMRSEVKEISATEMVPQVQRSGDGLRLRLWPHLHGTDGMFLSLLRREF